MCMAIESGFLPPGFDSDASFLIIFFVIPTLEEQDLQEFQTSVVNCGNTTTNDSICTGLFTLEQVSDESRISFYFIKEFVAPYTRDLFPSCWVFFRVILAARWCAKWTALGSRQRCCHLKATPRVKHGKIQWWSWPNWAPMKASWLRQWGRSYPPPPTPPAPATAPAHLPPPVEALPLTPPSSSSSISSSYPCVSASSHRNFIRINMMSRA